MTDQTAPKPIHPLHVYVAAQHVGISDDAADRFLGTLEQCGFTLAALSPPTVDQTAPRMTREEIEGWRTKIKNKIFNEFCGEPNESEGKVLMGKFDDLCNLALSALSPPPAQEVGDWISRLRAWSEELNNSGRLYAPFERGDADDLSTLLRALSTALEKAAADNSLLQGTIDSLQQLRDEFLTRAKAAETALQKAEAELAALKGDAERYRWLKSLQPGKGEFRRGHVPQLTFSWPRELADQPDLDAAIDAAKRSETQRETPS